MPGDLVCGGAHFLVCVGFHTHPHWAHQGPSPTQSLLTLAPWPMRLTLVTSLLKGWGFQCKILRGQINLFSPLKCCFRSSLCILDTRPLSDTICKCFLHSVFYRISHKTNISNFDEAQCINFSFYGLCFWS